METRILVPEVDDSPYALQSDLGWETTGRISQYSNGKDNQENEIKGFPMNAEGSLGNARPLSRQW